MAEQKLTADGTEDIYGIDADIDDGHPQPFGPDTHGIVDERQGGVIAYCHADNTVRLVAALRAEVTEPETAEQITQRVLALESLGTWEERIKAAVYLARDEQYRVTESPTQIAERVLDNHRIRPDWRRTGEQIIPLLAEAVRIARGEES
ncbi:hypothetical protein SEA_SALLYK_102 [Microbacterium phage SallyK]|nr:hypothetical protein SEA_SALLYK_102 [Microbacterium phage SallyK]